MEDAAIKQLWQIQNQMIEKCLSIHQKNTEDITKMKVHSLLHSMKPVKIFTLVAGFLWVLPLGFFLINVFLFAYQQANLFFLYSMSIQVLLTAIAIGIYCYQLDLISKTSFDQPVVQLQERLSKLKLSTLWSTRVLFLQLPLWTTFYLTKSTIQNGSLAWLVLQACITTIFTVAAFWIFFNIRYENRNKKWFRRIFNGKEWTPLMKSIALLDEIAELKAEQR